MVAWAKEDPAWVDNFQATGTLQSQKDCLKAVVPWLDSQD